MEDLATGYWFSEALFVAVELEVFTLLEPQGLTTAELAGALAMPVPGLGRFLQALCALGLVLGKGDSYFNTQLASTYLVRGTRGYQGDSILWRKALMSGWQDFSKCLKAGGRVNFPAEGEDPSEFALRIRNYINAMDNVAKTKVREILPFFAGLDLRKMLDVGTGSGAIAAGFLEQFPSLSATLLDIHEVLIYTRELLDKRGFGKRVCYSPTNILEPWTVAKEGFDLVVLSNIIHVYSEEELPLILDQAANCLNSEGILVIHDFFPEHFPEKAALLDLNMFINTYNGRIFPQAWVREQLTKSKLYPTELIPLETDTAVIFAAKDETKLLNLRLETRT
ncbi:MAG: class I SAM-dependent methyltransferase [Desulfosporosinus sp.]|nr:class I SAM-dependent methyltransferase [Desulfosporosinus sp.]